MYSDIDNICMTPLDNFINDDDELVLVKDRSIGNQGLIYNSFIATNKNNPILKKAIDLVVYNVLNNIYPDSGIKRIDILSVSGPRCLAIALNNSLNRTIFRDFTIGTQEHNGIKFRLLDIIEKFLNGEFPSPVIDASASEVSPVVVKSVKVPVAPLTVAVAVMLFAEQAPVKEAAAPVTRVVPVIVPASTSLVAVSVPSERVSLAAL